MKHCGPLSPKQALVLAYQANGYAAKQAAAEMGMSKRTLEHHSLMIKQKLGAVTQAQAVAIAMFMGYLEAEVDSAET